MCALLLGTAVGCGTSRSGAASTTKTTATATPPATQSATEGATQSATQTATQSATRSATRTATQTGTQATSETATGTPPTGPETTTNPGAPASGGAPPEDARIPATFTIVPGGSLNPPTITAPEHIPVQVTVVSGDGRPHSVVLRTPTTRAFAVPAHGHATVLLTGLKLGRYALDVDGTARGTLVIGGAPGP